MAKGLAYLKQPGALYVRDGSEDDGSK